MLYLLDKSFLLSLSQGHLSSPIAPRPPATVFISAASIPDAGMRHIAGTHQSRAIDGKRTRQ